jgi:poly(A) polymerase
LRLSFLNDPKVQHLFTTLDGEGEELRVVGGAIRNALLGEAVHEIDFASTALPQISMARAEKAGLRCVPTGIDHGTVTIIIEGTPFEVTTLREDVETDGRRAKVRFGRNFEHDALRRDFTMNALSCRSDGEIFDYVGGLADLERRHVRFIGDAIQRVREDYLRILRFFRFHAAYGQGALDQEAFHAAIQEREGMHNLSRERIRAELLKLVVTRNAGSVVAQMCGAGLLIPVLAGIAVPSRLARVAAIEQTRGDTPDAILRLMALCMLVREDADRLRGELRLSNAESERLIRAARVREIWHGREWPPAQDDALVMLYEHGRQAVLDALTLIQAESHAAGDDASWQDAHKFLSETAQPQLPFSGADLVAQGITPGPRMGEMLKTLQALWIRAGFPRDPDALNRLLRKVLGQA